MWSEFGKSGIFPASWFGVDLDRMEVISVQRHIYDRRATLTKPFIDPSFQSWDHRSFVRKWFSSGGCRPQVMSGNAPFCDIVAQSPVYCTGTHVFGRLIVIGLQIF